MTFIYVTHSQEEALTMSDRIILMARGRIVQEGSPHDLFEHPNSTFAAKFMGVENVFDGVLEQVAGGTISIRIGEHVFGGRWASPTAPLTGQPASLAVRAEKTRTGTEADAGSPANALSCTAQRTVYKGKYFDQIVECPIGHVVARIWDAGRDGVQPTRIWWREDDCVIVPRD